jgi:hypothetical protein
MSKATSKQLGSILNRLPPATAAGGEETAAIQGPNLSYAPAARAAAAAPHQAPEVPLVTAPAAKHQAPDAPPTPAPLPLADEREVPLQVLIPMRVRIELDRMHAETRKPLRRLVLESLRAIGLDVTEEDLAGKRGQKKLTQA